jgi:colicin import membrane protein
MSGVSVVSGGGIDLDAIVAGGPDLLKRMEDFKAARDTAVQAQADLALGKEVHEARDQLARDRAAFEADKAAQTAAIEKHIADIKADLDAWKRETIAKTMADREAAAADRESADRVLAAANKYSAAAAQKLAEAEDKLAAANNAHEAVKAAQAALAKALP